jgi:hypothetical protein
MGDRQIPTLEEGDHVDESSVASLAFPWLDNDSVILLQSHMLGVGV